MRLSKVAYIPCLLVLLSLNLCTKESNAQYYSSDPTFFGGFVVGLNMAQVDGDNLAGFRCLGLTTGGVIHSEIADNLTLSMGILYSEKGSKAGPNEVPKWVNQNSFRIDSHDIRIQCAEIPILLNYWIDKKIHAGGGFAVARLVNAKEFLNGIEQQELFPFKKYDFSLVLDGNYRITKGLFFNLRYQFSLLNIRKQNNPNAGRPEQFNRLVSFRLKYLFGK